MTFTDKEINKFRKKIGNAFVFPENHIVFSQIANMPIWQREIFKWQGNNKISKGGKR